MTNFSKFQSPDWNPPKQSLGQILDKLGVSGVLKAVRGKRVRNTSQKRSHTHKVLFSELISEKILHCSYKKCFFLRELILAKITYHVFVCDSENYMEKSFGNYFLGKPHFSHMKFGFRNFISQSFLAGV